MRIEKKLDKWLWFIIMLLPALLTIFNLLGSNGTISNGAQYLESTLTVFGLNTRGIVAVAIENLGSYIAGLVFEVGGIVNMYMCYIIYVQLAHVVVDVCLFVVKVGRELCERIL